MTNGVRQGSILSPLLFNVFIDGLSSELNGLTVGCYMNNTCFNHLNYADDSVLLAPTPLALQKLIDVCYAYSLKYEMLYNVKKTRCIAFKCTGIGDIFLPKMYLGSEMLKWIDTHTYLGAVLESNCKDNLDIFRQIKSIYARGNGLIHKFSKCSEEAKVELFRAYCSNFYLCQLWCNYNVSTYRKLKVAYNNVFRALLNVNRRDSVSEAFVRTNCDCFNVTIRKSVYNFYSRIMASGNSLVSTIVSSIYFTSRSKLFKEWNSLLFIYN